MAVGKTKLIVTFLRLQSHKYVFIYTNVRIIYSSFRELAYAIHAFYANIFAIKLTWPNLPTNGTCSGVATYPIGLTPFNSLKNYGSSKGSKRPILQFLAVEFETPSLSLWQEQGKERVGIGKIQDRGMFAATYWTVV